jgi:hypothetical protein
MRRLCLLLGLVVGLLLVFSVSNWAVERELDESKIKKCVSTAEKLQIVPLEAIEAGKDICEVIHTGPAVWCIENWIQGGESFGSYQDPLEAGCIDPYPFQVIEVHFMLCASQPCITLIYVDLMEANLDDLACPFPGQGIFTSDYYTLEIPGPGEYLVTVPVEEKVCLDGPYFAGFNFPNPVVGLGPITDDTPDGCLSYIWFETDPLDLTAVGFPGNVILHSVGLTALQNSCSDEYPPPMPEIVMPNDTAWYDQTYFSDSVEIQVHDTSDGSKIAYATFEYMDPTGIWHLIGTDYDGAIFWFNTWDTTQVGGDGWSCIWLADDLEEDYYLIRATMTDSLGRSASDTITIYYDPLPPVPTIIQPESTGVYCSPIQVLFTLEADHVAEIEGMVCRFDQDWYEGAKAGDSAFNKGIATMKQGDFYPDGKNSKGQRVNMGCAPTAAAACLKWWAAHKGSYDSLTAGLTDSMLVDSLARYMKTSPSTGTAPANSKKGLNEWVETKLGQCVFKRVKWKYNIKFKKGFKVYSKEIKKEDILISNGSHVMTGNSVTAKPRQYDVMDPATGTYVNYPWGVGAGRGKIWAWLILSPKVQPPPCPPTPPPELYSVANYSIVWTPDTTETPYNSWYSFHVTVTDSLGHVGEDLFHFKLADYVCGDANGDGICEMGDIVYDINYVFRDGDPPEPMEAGDANCDQIIELGDIVYLINFVFKEGPYPGCF